MMRTALVLIMTCNAALLLVGAVQHAGVSLGTFHEPKIVPAAIVEAVCGIFLLWASIAIFLHSSEQWKVALIGNLVALGGVLLGVAALAAGKGPRTASNDLHHRIMLVLIGVSVIILFYGKSTLQRK